MNIFDRFYSAVISGRATRIALPIVLLLVLACAVIAINDYLLAHQPKVILVESQGNRVAFGVYNCSSVEKAEEIFINSSDLKNYKTTMGIDEVSIELPQKRELDGSFVFKVSHN